MVTSIGEDPCDQRELAAIEAARLSGMGRRLFTRIGGVGALVVVVAVAGGLVLRPESGANQRFRHIAAQAALVPPCGPATEIHGRKGAASPPGLASLRVVTCGDPMGLGDLVVVETFKTRAALLGRMRAALGSERDLAQCATETERFEMYFASNDASATSGRDERGWDRAFCKRIGAGQPQFAGDFLNDGP